MASNPVEPDVELRGNDQARAGSYTEEQAFYDAQAQGFIALAVRNRRRRRRKLKPPVEG